MLPRRKGGKHVLGARRQRGLLALAMTIAVFVGCASQVNGPSPSVTGTNGPSSTSCGTPVAGVGAFLFANAMGVQNGVELRLHANQPPLKVMWANRSAAPPRAMSIRIVRPGGQAPELSMLAGWAPTQAEPSFPAGSLVTGYVSEIPTLPSAGCWEFSWIGGSTADKVVLRAAP